MADQFGFWNATPPDLVPLQRSFVENDEAAAGVNHALLELFREHLAERLFDIHVQGAPHLGSFDLMRKTVNADGLALLSGEGEEEATRYLYRAWKGRNGNGRGLHFLRTYMQMLYPNQWSVAQLWQDPALPYTTGMQTEAELTSLSGPGTPGWVLTSRVRIGIDYDAPLATSFGEMIKVLSSVLPARIVPEFSTRVPTSVGDGDGDGTGGSSGGAHAVGIGLRGTVIAHLNPPIEFPVSVPRTTGMGGLVVARLFAPPEVPVSVAPAVAIRGIFGVARLAPMSPDEWQEWPGIAPPEVPVSVAPAVAIRGIFGVARLAPMSPDEWQEWPGIAPPEVPTSGLDDFYRGLVAGYTTGQFPHWGDADDGDCALISLLSQGMLPF